MITIKEGHLNLKFRRMRIYKSQEEIMVGAEIEKVQSYIVKNVLCNFKAYINYSVFTGEQWKYTE